MSETTNPETLPWHQQFWPWFLIALLALAVIASVTSLGIAIFYRDSLVRDNYYKDGLAINTEIEQDKTAAQRNILIDGEIDHLTLTLKLAGAFVQPPHTLTMQFIHPLLDKNDFSIELQRRADGLYSGTLPAALTGRWHVEIGTPDDAQWRLRQLIDFSATPIFQLAQPVHPEQP